MTAKSITGILILSLNLAGVCFMVLMFLSALKNRFLKRGVTTPKDKPTPNKKRVKPEVSLKKADYLLDDMDLSEFDDLDLDDL